MKKFFQALYAQIMTVEGVVHCRMWNNQLERVMKGEMQLFDMPAVFIEFITSDTNGSSMGGGVQIFNPVIFKLHILHKQYDAGDGTFEQNLDVYDLKDLIYKKVYKLQPGLTDETNPIGSCIRISEEQDYQHHIVYHYIQTYQTTFVDFGMEEPVNGIEWSPNPMPLELDTTYTKTTDIAVTYDSTVRYFAVNETLVNFEDKYYKIAVDTPNPAGVFNPVYWELITLVTNFTPET